MQTKNIEVNRSEAKVDLVMIQTLLLSKTNFFVIMLTRYCSLSQQGHLQPHSKSKATKYTTVKWPIVPPPPPQNYLF